MSDLNPTKAIAAALLTLALWAWPAGGVQAETLASSKITYYPALTSFALTNTSTASLHVLLEEDFELSQHELLSTLCYDARNMVNKRHWVLPTVRSWSRMVTHNGVVLVRPEPESEQDATARLLPTLSLSTFGARLRVSF